MSQTRSSVAVGSFVIAGLLLLVLGIGLLGGGNLFADDLEYTLIFDGSVSGLTVGAPVVFRGVPLGAVTNIQLQANPRDGSVSIPVGIRINEGAINDARSGEKLPEEERIKMLAQLVQRGLRARLQLQSLITGQYRIELDFYPDSLARYRSADPATEIPTLPSPIDQLQRNLSALPLKELVTSFQGTLQRLSDILASPDIDRGITQFANTFEEANRLLVSSRETQRLVNQTMNNLSQASAVASTELPRSLEALTQAMNGFTAVAHSTQALVGRDSPAVNELRRLLREATAAMRSLRALADTLERNPESLLRGRSGGQR